MPSAQEGPPHPCPGGPQAGRGVGPLLESPSPGAPQPRFVQQNLEHGSDGPSLTGLFLSGLQMGVTTECDHGSDRKTVSTGPAGTPRWAEVVLATPGAGPAGPHLLCDLPAAPSLSQGGAGPEAMARGGQTGASCGEQRWVVSHQRSGGGEPSHWLDPQERCKRSGTLTTRLAPCWPRPQRPDEREAEAHLIVSVI